MGQTHRGVDRFIQHLYLVMLLERDHHRAKHANTFGFVRLFDFYNLESARERGVLLDVTFVFIPGSSGEGPQCAAGQGWFEQIRSIAGTAASAGADERMGL